MKPVGAEVGLRYDSADGVTVSVGDFLRTGTGRTYFVTSAREAGTPAPPWARRWALRAVVVPPEEAPEDAVTHPVRWYHRGRRRAR